MNDDAAPAPRKGLPLGFGAAFFSLFTVLGLVFVFVGIVVPGVRIEHRLNVRPAQQPRRHARQ